MHVWTVDMNVQAEMIGRTTVEPVFPTMLLDTSARTLDNRRVHELLQSLYLMKPTEIQQAASRTVEEASRNLQDAAAVDGAIENVQKLQQLLRSLRPQIVAVGGSEESRAHSLQTEVSVVFLHRVAAEYAQEHAPRDQVLDPHLQGSADGHRWDDGRSTPSAAPSKSGEEPVAVRSSAWTRHFDPQTGCHYYWHAADGVSKWEPVPVIKKPSPPIARPEAEAPLPSGWSAHADEQSGQTYFAHEGTGVSQWERPVDHSTAPRDFWRLVQPSLDSEPYFMHSRSQASNWTVAVPTRVLTDGNTAGPARWVKVGQPWDAVVRVEVGGGAVWYRDIVESGWRGDMPTGSTVIAEVRAHQN